MRLRLLAQEYQAISGSHTIKIHAFLLCIKQLHNCLCKRRAAVHVSVRGTSALSADKCSTSMQAGGMHGSVQPSRCKQPLSPSGCATAPASNAAQQLDSMLPSTCAAGAAVEHPQHSTGEEPCGPPDGSALIALTHEGAAANAVLDGGAGAGADASESPEQRCLGATDPQNREAAAAHASHRPAHKAEHLQRKRASTTSSPGSDPGPAAASDQGASKRRRQAEHEVSARGNAACDGMSAARAAKVGSTRTRHERREEEVSDDAWQGQTEVPVHCS